MGAFEVRNGIFGEILPEVVPGDAVDLRGQTVIPGLIDIRAHGNSGADFSGGDYEGLKRMAEYYAKCGVTSFAPASMTLPYEILEKAFATARKLVDEKLPGLSVLRGIQMEGPYFSYKKRGAQNADYLKEPDFEGFKKLYDGCGGMVRIVDVAPELPGAAEFIKQAKEICTVSVAHTDSDYDHAKMAFDAALPI
jgi:N-acetylglucosamine-6-phosphate deacetylase